jgi:hypothetical protein
MNNRVSLLARLALTERDIAFGKEQLLNYERVIAELERWGQNPPSYAKAFVRTYDEAQQAYQKYRARLLTGFPVTLKFANRVGKILTASPRGMEAPLRQMAQEGKAANNSNQSRLTKPILSFLNGVRF